MMIVLVETPNQYFIVKMESVPMLKDSVYIGGNHLGRVTMRSIIFVPPEDEHATPTEYSWRIQVTPGMDYPF